MVEMLLRHGARGGPENNVLEMHQAEIERQNSEGGLFYVNYILYKRLW